MDVNASYFKAHCLELLDRVKDTHTEIIVTKRGKPVARLVPCESQPPAGLLGLLAGLGRASSVPVMTGILRGEAGRFGYPRVVVDLERTGPTNSRGSAFDRTESVASP